MSGTQPKYHCDFASVMAFDPDKRAFPCSENRLDYVLQTNESRCYQKIKKPPCSMKSLLGNTLNRRFLGEAFKTIPKREIVSYLFVFKGGHRCYDAIMKHR